MIKNPYGRILKGESKKQHLSIVLKSCPYGIIQILKSQTFNFQSQIKIEPEISARGGKEIEHPNLKSFLSPTEISSNMILLTIYSCK